MAVRNAKPTIITNWLGYDTWTDYQEVPANAFIDSSNVVITPNGNVVALRSPANFNTALSFNQVILSGADWQRDSGGNIIIFDIEASGSTATYATSAGGVNTLLFSGGSTSVAWQSLNVDGKLYHVTGNGQNFLQIYNATSAGTSFTFADVGITGPGAAPTVGIVSGGSGDLEAGIYISYAYYNNVTLHTGECSSPSLITGPTSSGNNTVRTQVVASTEQGVSNIVLFYSEDGGVVRFLLTDINGDPQFFPNTTGNIDVSVANIYLNLNVEETAFNAPPPAGITFMARWKNRIIGTLGRLFVYSGFDQIAMGIPWETWPPLNFLTIPNKGELAKGGIETEVGFLAFSETNAYLFSGTPTDTIDSGENTIQTSEQLDQLGWNIGTRSPRALCNTPYGTVIFDNNKHLQLWPWQGAPLPMALGIWPDLATIQDTDAAMAMVEATWFPAGGANGGFYVLTASTSGSTNNRMWIIMMIRTNNGIQIAPCPSSIAAQCVFNARINGKLRSFIGVTDRLREILDFDLAGAGWNPTDKLYFDFVLGNQMTNFNRFHSLELNGLRPEDAIVRVSDMDQTGQAINTEVIPMSFDSGSYFGMVDRYSTRHRVQIAYQTDDTNKREIKNLRLVSGQKKRVI